MFAHTKCRQLYHYEAKLHTDVRQLPYSCYKFYKKENITFTNDYSF